MESFDFTVKTKTKFGEGIAKNLGTYLKDLHLQRIGIIVDSGVATTPYVKEILKKINDEHFQAVHTWVYDLKGEPDYDSLDRINAKYHDSHGKTTVDCFVGIGGGSVIDFSKGLATLATNPGEALQYRGFPPNLNMSLPIIAIPTTAGTASEITYNAVFIDTKSQKKLGINTTNNFPTLAILDPLLPMSCPRSVAVSSGGDALVHTMESYVHVNANSVTRIFARRAFQLLFNNLENIIKKPKDVQVWADMQLGSYLAGISLMNAGSGPAGALSYTLGTRFHVPHGIAGTIFLPHIVTHNVTHGYDYSELYDLIKNVDTSVDKKTKNKEFSKKFFDICKHVGVPENLHSFGVNEDNIAPMLSDIDNYEKAFAQNPIPFSIQDGKNLLQKLVKP